MKTLKAMKLTTLLPLLFVAAVLVIAPSILATISLAVCLVVRTADVCLIADGE
jgi:hypothetical protein